MLPSEDSVPLLLPLELCTPPVPEVPEDWVVLYQKIRIEENGEEVLLRDFFNICVGEYLVPNRFLLLSPVPCMDVVPKQRAEENTDRSRAKGEEHMRVGSFTF